MGTLTAVQIPDWFRAQMARMIGLRFVPQDLTTHWEALASVPEPLIELAVSRAQIECKNFPVPWTLRSFADQARRGTLATTPEADRTVDLLEPMVLGHLPTGTPVVARRLWKYYCEDCSDSGLVTCWCGDGDARWNRRQSCGRSKEHYAHEWVRPCPCASTNPDILRRKEQAQIDAASRRTDHEN